MRVHLEILQSPVFHGADSPVLDLKTGTPNHCDDKEHKYNL